MVKINFTAKMNSLEFMAQMNLEGRKTPSTPSPQPVEGFASMGEGV